MGRRRRGSDKTFDKKREGKEGRKKTTSQLLWVLITSTLTSISSPLCLMLLTSPSNVDRTTTNTAATPAAAGSSTDFLLSRIELQIMINVVSYFLFCCYFVICYFTILWFER